MVLKKGKRKHLRIWYQGASHSIAMSPCVEIMVTKVIGCPRDARGEWESESVFHLMPESMVSRLDPLSTALFNNLYGIRNHPKRE